MESSLRELPTALRMTRLENALVATALGGRSRGVSTTAGGNADATRLFFGECLADTLPGVVEGFGEDAGFADDAGEIGVGDPAREDVHVNVSGDAGARGLADIHAEINAVGMVERAENGFHALGERHHFVGGSGGEFLQLVEVSVGDDHDVAVGVGIGIKDDVAVGATVDDAGLFVGLARGVAENAGF